MAKCLVISKKYFTKSQFDVTGIFPYTVKELPPHNRRSSYKYCNYKNKVTG